MDEWFRIQCTAFEGSRLIASGELVDVALKVKEVIDRGGLEPILIFDNLTSRPVEVDFRGKAEEVRKRLLGEADSDIRPEVKPRGAKETRGPGRPKLGVVAREVTLLPRHWDWLNRQPGGASVALRKLVEEARHGNETRDRVRQSQEAAYRFMTTMAGNLPGYEEAARALFAGNAERFHHLIEDWPKDVREHAKKLASGAQEGGCFG